MFLARREGARPEGALPAHFFEVYKDLEPGKSVDIERGIWAGRTEAEVEVRRSQGRDHQPTSAR